MGLGNLRTGGLGEWEISRMKNHPVVQDVEIALPGVIEAVQCEILTIAG
jgi:hypothetical protein